MYIYIDKVQLHLKMQIFVSYIQRSSWILKIEFWNLKIEIRIEWKRKVESKIELIRNSESILVTIMADHFSFSERYFHKD